MYAIYSLTPAPWGDSYRYVEGFEWREDAEKVMKCLNSVNINFNLYVIVNMNGPRMTKIDMQKMFEEGAPKIKTVKAKPAVVGTVTGRLSSKRVYKSNTPKSNPIKPIEKYDGNVVLPKI